MTPPAQKDGPLGGSRLGPRPTATCPDGHGSPEPHLHVHGQQGGVGTTPCASGRFGGKAQRALPGPTGLQPAWAFQGHSLQAHWVRAEGTPGSRKCQCSTRFLPLEGRTVPGQPCSPDTSHANSARPGHAFPAATDRRRCGRKGLPYFLALRHHLRQTGKPGPGGSGLPTPGSLPESGSCSPRAHLQALFLPFVQSSRKIPILPKVTPSGEGNQS